MSTGADLELCIGSPPHTFAGAENSTGYAFQLEVEDSAIIATRKVTDVRDAKQRGLCGGSTGFVFEFYPLKAGRCKVRVTHGRPWDPSTLQERAAYTFVVPGLVTLEEEAAASAAVTAAERRLAEARAAGAAQGLALEEEEVAAAAIDGGAADGAVAGGATAKGAAADGPGFKLYNAAVELGRWAPLLAQAAARNKSRRAHEVALAEVATALAGVEAERLEVEASLGAARAAAEAREEARARALEAADPEGRLLVTATYRDARPLAYREALDGGSQEEVELFAAKEDLRLARAAVEALREQLAEVEG